MSNATSNGVLRFTRGSKCPVCGGCDDDPRGQGQRCQGYLSSNRGVIFCGREEYGSQTEYDAGSGCYKHSAKGPCKCGSEHAPADPKPGKSEFGEIDQVYKYHDANGTAIFEVVRFKAPKGFRQRQPGKGPGGKDLWSLKGVKRVLYKLPLLLAANPAELVWIVEGEKDADRLGTLGLIATTSPMGAGKWRDEYADTLRGRDVVILPDNDGPGREHAQRVAQSLQGKAASVKVVELPGLPDKGDVSDFLASGKTVDDLRGLVAQSAEWKPSAADDQVHDQAEDKRPKILVTHEEFMVNDQAIAAPSGQADVYQRNLRLVTVAVDEKPSSSSSIQRADGTPLIRPIQPARLREDLTRIASWKKLKALRASNMFEEVPTHPPDWSVAAILARENWPDIRYLVGIIETPTLRADGSVIDVPGFDKATGLLYVPNGAFPRSSRGVNRDDARASAKLLLSLVGDFPFKRGHETAWLAALLTVMGRFLIDGPVPLFLFEANVSGAGKTLLCDLISFIVTGRSMTRTGYTHDSIEMDKQISSTALAGDRVVLFDNLKNGGLFGNSALDRALTARTWRGRVLGKLEMTPDLDLVTVFFASGNNTALCGDVARRIVQCRLDSLEERPETRTGFRFPDLLGHAVANRDGLVDAALTILRAYIVAGKPDQKLKPMDFPAWAGLIRNAVYWSTGVDPCADRGELVNSNPEIGQAAALIEAWHDLQAEQNAKGFTVADVLRLLREDKDAKSHPSLRDALAEISSRTKPGELPSSGSIGMKIQAIRGQVIGGKRFVLIGEHKRAKVWGVEVLLGPGESSESSESYPIPRAENNTVTNVTGTVVRVLTGKSGGEKTHQTHQTHRGNGDTLSLARFLQRCRASEVTFTLEGGKASVHGDPELLADPEFRDELGRFEAEIPLWLSREESS